MHVKHCDRCKNLLPKVKAGQRYKYKAFYRYPHIFNKIEQSGSYKNSIFSTMLIFCEKCVSIFDELNQDMRGKYLYTGKEGNEKLIKFYKQYVRRK